MTGELGVPSSAAGHGPGQEKAPAGLRRAGLVERLTGGRGTGRRLRRPAGGRHPQHNAGLTFEEAMTCLAVLTGHEGLAGLVVTELNPDQGAEDGSTVDALVGGLVGALTG